MTPATPTFYFSLRSPYSWLAWHDLKTFYPKLLARLVLKPFWEPDADYKAELGTRGEAFLYTAMSRDKHLYILADVKRLAARRGLTVGWPVDKAPVWEVPHLAWLHAQAQGQGRACIDAITDMRWRQGRDICDPAVMEAVGAQLGLDPVAMRDAHRDPALRAQGLTALRDCIGDGVFGVPFFTVGRERFWGIDRLPDFIGAVAQATATQPVPQAPGERDECGQPHRAMLDHAGGCG